MNTPGPHLSLMTYCYCPEQCLCIFFQVLPRLRMTLQVFCGLDVLPPHYLFNPTVSEWQTSFAPLRLLLFILRLDLSPPLSSVPHSAQTSLEYSYWHQCQTTVFDICTAAFHPFKKYHTRRLPQESSHAPAPCHQPLEVSSRQQVRQE